MCLIVKVVENESPDFEIETELEFELVEMVVIAVLELVKVKSFVSTAAAGALHTARRIGRFIDDFLVLS